MIKSCRLILSKYTSKLFILPTASNAADRKLFIISLIVLTLTKDYHIPKNSR